MDSGCGIRYIVSRPDTTFLSDPRMASARESLYTSSSSTPRTVCGVIAFLALLFVAFVLLRHCMKGSSSSRNNGSAVYGAAGGQQQQPFAQVEAAAQDMGFRAGQDVVARKAERVPLPEDPQPPKSMKCSVTQGQAPPGPDVKMAIDGSVYQPRTDWGVLTQTSGKIPSALVNTESNAGSPFEINSFVPSAATQEFYDTNNPSKLTSMMPASWRANGREANCVEPSSYNDGGGPTQAKYDDFGRYSVSPMSAQHAEALRGTIRLSELSSTRNARTLGTPSLLREMVTPVSPIPVGSDMMTFLDSEERLAMIAAATGQFPDTIGC